MIYFLLGSKFAAATATRPPIYNSEQKIDQDLLMKRKEGPGKDDIVINREALADHIAFHHNQIDSFFPEPESPDPTWDIVSSADEADLRDAFSDGSDHDTISVHSEDLHYFETEMDDFTEQHPDLFLHASQITGPVSIHGSPEDSTEGSLKGSNSQ